MLKFDNQQISLADYLIPEELTVLDDELSIIDKYLNDEKIVQPFIEYFHKKHGRPSTPLQVYIRMMYLKHMYSLSYEELHQQVSDSIKLRRFCHIPLDARVPDGSTLCKLTKLFGNDTLDKLNKIIITKAVEEKKIKARKVRIDTTVAESNIHYPTDAELLEDCVRVITRTVNRIAEAANDAAGKIRNRGRSIKKKILAIAKTSKRRTQEKFHEIREITGQIAEVARHTVADAKKALARAKQVTGIKIKDEAQIGCTPKEVATDRGFYSKDNEDKLHTLGVKRVSMPKRGKKSKARKELESAFWFKRLQRFRAGSEATISMLKRCRGLNRILSRGTSGSKSWIAMGIMAHNLWKLAQL
jgi:IS5 family transposase